MAPRRKRPRIASKRSPVETAEAEAAGEGADKRVPPGGGAPGVRSKAGPSGATAASARAPREERWLCVKRHLHLGLGLRLGGLYTEQDLRRRCNGNQAKLNTLEQFIADPRVLAEANAKGGKPSEQKSRPRSARAEQAEAARARQRDEEKAEQKAEQKGSLSLQQPAALEQPRPMRSFILGQVVWSMSSVPPRPAKVMAITSKLEVPYRVRFLDTKGEEAGPESEAELPEDELQAVNVDDLRGPREQAIDGSAEGPANTSAASTGQQASSPSQSSPCRRPGPRSCPAHSPTPGQVVWVLEPNQPPWLGEVLATAPGEAGAAPLHRVRLLGVVEEEAVVQVGTDRLLAFCGGDAAALASVTAEAEALHKKTPLPISPTTDAAAEAQTEPTAPADAG